MCAFRFITVLAVLLLGTPVPVRAADDLLDFGRAATIDYMLDRAVAQGLIGGGVALVGTSRGITYTVTRGRTGLSADAPPITERTLFDIASLTKVIATAPAVMKLVEEGRVSLMDPLTRWFPEFEGTGREDITVLNLLTHTSGLNDVAIGPNDPLGTAIHKAAIQKSGRLPGSAFHYADINYILLSELVRRAAWVPLDRYCLENFFGPLGMGDTMFLPPRELSVGIAPTLNTGNELQTGIVQDENARYLGGIAGHAGLFSSASDLARFAMMILNNGRLHGKRVLSERTLEQMTAPYYYSSGRVVRGLGWDIRSPYSSPRGDFFSRMSFGHTGYSGTSIWIDPRRDLFVILLTVRYNYRDTRHINRLRSDISTIAASVFSPPETPQETAENM